MTTLRPKGATTLSVVGSRLILRHLYEQRRGGVRMATGKKAAAKAGKQLGSKTSTKAEKSVAASDLAQAKKSGKKKK